MTEYLAFWGENWFLGTIGALFILQAFCSVTELVRQVALRCLRVMAVAIRGWPPSHLDADGDWLPVKAERIRDVGAKDETRLSDRAGS